MPPQRNRAYNPWDNGSTLYRRALLTGMAVVAIGIIMAIIGAVSSIRPVSYTALAIIALGLLIHLFAQWTRFRQATRDRQQRDTKKKN